MTSIKQPKRKTTGKKNVSSEKTKKNIFPKKKMTQKKPRHRQAYGISKLEAYFAHEFLDRLGLNYIYEYEAKDIGRFYDFAIVYLPVGKEIIYEDKHGVKCVDYLHNELRISFLIEIDGSYFHSDPRLVDENKLNPMQKHNKFVDKLKNGWCIKHKLPLLRIWEYDIRNNPKGVMEQIQEMLDKLSGLEKIKAGLNKPHPRKK